MLISFTHMLDISFHFFGSYIIIYLSHYQYLYHVLYKI